LDESKECWKEVQTRLVAEVERTIEENGRLKQATASRNAEIGKLKSEGDAAVRRQQQVREEIGPLRPVLGTGEVRPTNTVQPVVETVDAPAPSMEDHTPEAEATPIGGHGTEE
jgi:hypothetical protein